MERAGGVASRYSRVGRGARQRPLIGFTLSSGGVVPVVGRVIKFPVPIGGDQHSGWLPAKRRHAVAEHQSVISIST